MTIMVTNGFLVGISVDISVFILLEFPEENVMADHSCLLLASLTHTPGFSVNFLNLCFQSRI